MTGEVVSLRPGPADAYMSVSRLGKVRGVAVEVWREDRPGGGLRVVLTPTAEGFSTVALFPADCLPIAEKCGWVVFLTVQALGATWA